jgi:PKD repeat protein
MCAGTTTFTLNATGLAAISKTSVTKLGIRDDYEVRNIGGSDGSFNISSAGSGSNRPALTITYTVPPPAPTTSCTSYTWNFNDGSPVVTSSDETQTHTYTSAGVHTITFSAQDAEGYSCPTTPAAKPLSGGGLLFPKWKEVLP